MQIGSSNPLTFLPGQLPAQPAAPKASDTDSSSPAAQSGAARVALPVNTPEQEAAGVILRLQSDLAATPGAALPKDLVYSNSRKSAPSQDSAVDPAADNERMALQHSQALERSAASSTSLSVDKDGVLVALPASAAEVKAQAFVHHAVTAMREYADAQERLKTAGQSADSGSILPRSLAEVQKLASRFKLFA